jgi:hypothetical protein
MEQQIISISPYEPMNKIILITNHKDSATSTTLLIPNLNFVMLLTELHMLQETLHNNRKEVHCWSKSYVSCLCNQQAAGRHLVFGEVDYAKLGQTLYWSQNMASDCGCE